nr:hypothetical protein [Clostridia bacterium]
MFGYVKPVVSELLVKENEFYRATYCGICRAMKRHTGRLSTVTLTYDSVFLALVRMAYIPDSELSSSMRRCIAHPMKKKNMLNENSAIEYTARAFGILTYYKMRDDLTDERAGKRMLLSLLRPIASDAKKRANLSELSDTVRDRLEKITEHERARTASVDEPASLFGELLGEIFSFGLSGEDKLVTYQCGFHLGKFIYAADAAEDYSEDKRLGRYNPFIELYGGAELTAENKASIKCALLLECRALEGAVNLIPFGRKITVENIVRNIIYLGLTKRIEFLDGEDGEEKKGQE